VTDGQMDGRTDRHTLHDSKDRAYASHCAVKISRIQNNIPITGHLMSE